MNFLKKWKTTKNNCLKSILFKRCLTRTTSDSIEKQIMLSMNTFLKIVIVKLEKKGQKLLVLKELPISKFVFVNSQ